MARREGICKHLKRLAGLGKEKERNSKEKERTCAICMENISSKKLKLPCGHIFHIKCGLKWLNQAGTCPYCRAVVCDVKQGERITVNIEANVWSNELQNYVDICDKPWSLLGFDEVLQEVCGKGFVLHLISEHLLANPDGPCGLGLNAYNTLEQEGFLALSSKEQKYCWDRLPYWKQRDVKMRMMSTAKLRMLNMAQESGYNDIKDMVDMMVERDGGNADELYMHRETSASCLWCTDDETLDSMTQKDMSDTLDIWDYLLSDDGQH